MENFRNGIWIVRLLDCHFRRCQTWKVIKPVPEGAASDVELHVRRVHIKKKKKSSSRRSGCRGDAQDASSSLSKLDLNPTAQSAEQGWSSSCVEMPGEEAQTALQRLRRRWKTEYQPFQVRNEMCECGTLDKRMEEAEKASSSQ